MKKENKSIDICLDDDFRSDPELSFLHTCLGACLFQDGPPLIPPSNLDWDRFLGLLIGNKLVGLFYKLGKSHPDLWPDQLAEQLRDECYRLESYGAWCEAQAKIVLTSLHQANIPAIVLKGWAIVQILYGGEFNQRPSSDIDLLVNPCDLAQVEAILSHLGYRDAAVEPWPGYFQRYLNSRHYLSSQSAAQTSQAFHLDIHWGIPDSPYYHQGTPIVPFFERSQPVRIADIEGSCLAMEDHLIYACSHIAHHAYEVPISNYYEIAVILHRAEPAVNWATVFSRASTLRVVIPLQHVLAHMAALWPGVISPGLMQTLMEQKTTCTERRVEAWLKKSKGREKLLGILAWFTTPGLLRKAGYILETLIPGPTYLDKYYGPSPLGLWPLLYPRRVALILFNRFK
jgi:hypothetical protein